VVPHDCCWKREEKLQPSMTKVVSGQWSELPLDNIWSPKNMCFLSIIFVPQWGHT
jgi:hypothetical protein